MEILVFDNYKEALKWRVREAKTTFKKLSEKIPIQYTYLSKVFNRNEVHLSEEHLFRTAELLDFYPDEIDFLFLLRSSATAESISRRNFLQNKIARIRKAQELKATVLDVDSRRFSNEMAYLFDPWTVLVHMSLSISEYVQFPRRLSPLLGISVEELENILKKLSHLDLIEFEVNSKKIKKVKMEAIHYGPHHPLTRAHQSLMRKLCAAHLMRLPEDDKESFMATFTADPDTFSKIKELLKPLLQNAEKYASRAKHKHTYQLNLDLFKWL